MAACALSTTVLEHSNPNLSLCRIQEVSMRLIMLCLMALFFALPTVAQENVPAPSGEIAFASNREDGIYQIYVMNADGSDVRQLTDGQTDSMAPVWSPDGQKIAFIRAVDPDTVSSQRYELWVMDADGSNAVQIVGEEKGDVSSITSAIWSPDSQHLLYASMVFHADGTQAQTLSPIENVYQTHFLTNETLLFTVKNGESYQGLLYDLSDDSTATLVEKGFALKPSPDGTQIPVMNDEQLTLFDINTETSQRVRETLPGLLPDEVGREIGLLVWSDDGSRMAGVLRVAVPYDPNSNIKPWRDLIFAVNLDGTEYVAMAVEGHELHVTLSPDGEYMAFSPWDEGGSHQIAIARADGTQPPMLITSQGENLHPAWRPAP
jgi:Tol biopolymer transport system component